MERGVSDRLPAFSVIAAALRATTERLSGELSNPRDTAPDWSELQWRIAQSSAVMQGTVALLGARLRWQGPESWRQFILAHGAQARERHRRIAAMLESIDGATRQRGIAVIGLKGAALLKLGLYAPGERPMADIDLLTRPGDAAAIEDIMHALGYSLAYRTLRHAVYLPRARGEAQFSGEHPSNPLKVEVHEAIAEALPVHSVDITTELWPGGASPGLCGYPDLVALMRHLLLHAATNMRAHALRQIQLHDIALLGARLTPQDWQRVGDGGKAEGAWWAYPPLALTARYYAGAVPPVLLQELRSRCSPWLRYTSARTSLTTVSWSNLRIHAFPGISWSRSAAEAMVFARSRVFPGRVARGELAATVAAMPSLNATPWYGLGHLHRILLWLFFRPPRVQAMIAVRAVLERPVPFNPP